MTWPTRWRVPHFADLDLGLSCLTAMEHERDRMGLDVIAYCLMPDHMHLIVGPTSLKIGQVVQGLKLASTHRLLADGLLIKTPWQRSYYDVGMRSGQQLRNAIEYLHNNPVRCGLTIARIDYPLGSCRDWELEEGGPIIIAKHLGIPD